MKKLIKEIESFQSMWRGGFLTGHDRIRNQKGIEEYLSGIIQGKRVLEIGCGGGQWSNFMHRYVQQLHCVDILSAEHNKFWERVGDNKKDKINYLHVDNFSLADIPDNTIEVVFSFDVFCHISLSGIDEYLKNIYAKCTNGALLLIMYADAKKYFSYHNPGYIACRGKGQPPTDLPQTALLKDLDLLNHKLLEECDGPPYPGRWYWVGITNFVNLCEKYGYEILNKDLDIDKRDPLTLFTKK